MTVKKRRLIANFEARSVALFATLSLGTVMALHAQTAAQQPIPPSKNNWTTAQISEAFKRLDANGDGLISREEAAQQVAITATPRARLCEQRAVSGLADVVAAGAKSDGAAGRRG